MPKINFRPKLIKINFGPKLPKTDLVSKLKKTDFFKSEIDTNCQWSKNEQKLILIQIALKSILNKKLIKFIFVSN